MIFGPREKSCYSKIMLWKSATKNFYSVIISHYTRENFYSVIISHYTREKCNHKKFQCYISLLMYIHTDKIFVQCIRLKIELINYFSSYLGSNKNSDPLTDIVLGQQKFIKQTITSILLIHAL